MLDLVLLEVLDWMLRLSVQVDGDMIPSEAEFITLSCTGQKRFTNECKDCVAMPCGRIFGQISLNCTVFAKKLLLNNTVQV